MPIRPKIVRGEGPARQGDAGSLPGTLPRSRVRRQIASVWVVQGVLIGAQVGYMSVTSRVIDQTGFGSYAIALAVITIAGLAANPGLSNAVSRRSRSSPMDDRRLVNVGLLTGFTAAGLVFLSAEPLAAVMQDSAAETTIRVAAGSLALYPTGAISLGILRRDGRIRAFNTIQLLASVPAMLIGCVIVWSTGQPWALATPAVLTTTLQTVLGVTVVGTRMAPMVTVNLPWSDLGFGIRSTGIFSIGMIVATIPTWILARACGTATVGSWNRASAVSRFPPETAARSVLSVLYPGFSLGQEHDSATARNWSALMSALGLAALVVGAIVLPAIDGLLALLLGPGWTTAAEMAPFLWVSGIGLLLTIVLGGALESAGKFKILLCGELIGFFALLPGAFVTLATATWLPLAISVALAPFAGHGVQLLLGSRIGMIHGWRVAGWYGIGCGIGSIGLIANCFLIGRLPWSLTPVISTILLVTAFLVLGRALKNLVPPLRQTLN